MYKNQSWGIGEVWIERKLLRDCAVLWDKGGLYFSEEATMKCLIQGCQGDTDWKRIMSHPNITPRHSPIHLIDSSLASSARGCDIADIGVCPPHSQTLLELYDDSQHIWRRSNLILVHILGGHIAGRTSGALLFKLILSMRPCGTYIWGQGHKISQYTVAWVAGGMLASWIHGWFVGEGLFVDTLPYVPCYYL